MIRRKYTQAHKLLVLLGEKIENAMATVYRIQPINFRFISLPPLFSSFSLCFCFTFYFIFIFCFLGYNIIRHFLYAKQFLQLKHFQKSTINKQTKTKIAIEFRQPLCSHNYVRFCKFFFFLFFLVCAFIRSVIQCCKGPMKISVFITYVCFLSLIANTIVCRFLCYWF